MSIASVAELMESIRSVELLEPAQLELLTDELLSKHATPLSLADLLVQWKWLTPYQIHELLQGRGKELLIGQYRVLASLGMGGMGQVYRAIQQNLNRVVAIKVIRQDRLSHDPEVVRRFKREAKATAQLSHPNIVTVHDAGEIGNIYFIAMEYIEGVDLSKLVREYGALPVDVACDYIHQAALGLQHAHEHNMVHRDIKPSNMLVTPARTNAGLSGLSLRPDMARKHSGELPMMYRRGSVVKILDMGLVRLSQLSEESSLSSLTHEGSLVGTPDYIAPEQARNAHIADIRSDLYSLGCTFYFLLTGQQPFPEGTNVVEKLLMHQLDTPKPLKEFRPEIGPEFQPIVTKLMAKRPEDRYQTPAELAAVLSTLPKTPGGTISSPSLSTETPERPQSVETASPVSASGADTPRPPSTYQLTPTQITNITTGFPKEPMTEEPPNIDQVAASVFNWPKAVREARDKFEDLPTAQVVARMKGHRGWVLVEAFSPNKDLLASGGVDGDVRLWDLTGTKPKLRAVCPANQGEVHSVAFSPDGRLLASGCGTLDGHICLWNLEAGPEPPILAIFRGHTASVEALAFSPDSKTLVSGSGDRTVRLWDLSGPKFREGPILKGHGDFVKSVAFAPDGKTLASGSQDFTVRLWNLTKTWSKEIAVLSGGMGHVQSVAFSPDGKTLAAGERDMTVRMWDLGGAAPVKKATLEGHDSVVRLVQFTPQGETLVSVGQRGRVNLWEVSTGVQLRKWRFSCPMMSAAALTSDGRYLVAGNTDGSQYIFRLYPKKEEESSGS